MGQRITDRDPISNIAYDDIIELTDVSDTSEHPDGKSVQTTVGQFLTKLGVFIEIPGWENINIKKAAGNTDLSQPEDGDTFLMIGSAYFEGALVFGTIGADGPADDADFNVIINLGNGS